VKFTDMGGEIMVVCSISCTTCYLRKVFGANKDSPYQHGGGDHLCPDEEATKIPSPKLIAAFPALSAVDESRLATHEGSQKGDSARGEGESSESLNKSQQREKSQDLTEGRIFTFKKTKNASNEIEKEIEAEKCKSGDFKKLSLSEGMTSSGSSRPLLAVSSDSASSDSSPSNKILNLG
jgi:hypothetical protein